MITPITYNTSQAFTIYSLRKYVLVTDGGEVKCFDVFMSHEKKNEWLKAIQEKMKSLYENHNFKLVKFSTG